MPHFIATELILMSKLKPFSNSTHSICLITFLILLSGCTGMNVKSTQANRPASNVIDTKILPPRQNVTHELVKQGIEYLREGDYEKAQKVFSAAVKVSPNSSTAHLLNGISYHLDYLNNPADNKELAETAYGLASSLDKTDTLPLIQLGRLHIDSREYSKASRDFISAYSISPSSQDALFGLLQSSLWQKDFKTALWAGDSLKKLNTTNVDQLRLMTLTYAAVGKTTESNLNFDAYAKANAENPKEIAQLKQQVAYISSQLSNLKSMDLDVAQNPANLKSAPPQQGKMMKVAGGVVVAKGTSKNSGSSTNSRGTDSRSGIAAYENNQNSDDSSDSGTSSGGSSGSSGTSATPSSSQATTAAPVSSGGGGGTYSAVSMATQQQRWFDCDTRPGLGKAPGGSYGVPVGGTTGDQTLYLEPLPSPCNAKKPPKMASIDAVLIRTIDNQTSSYGINLLNGLTMFAGSQSFRTTGSADGASVSGVVQNSVIGIGNATSATINSISGLVSYSLNIANSTSSNSQVIARPTLTALDRIPSTFYSGAIITAGLNGGGVSGAQITNIPTGVSLSVTPTFVDEESMMLAVKVSRSYVTAASQGFGGFNASVSQDQHAVTANVKIKYGETLILDGLSSRSVAGQQDGVPVLQDIPIIQYLFNQKKQQLYSENVVVLVTPRKVQTEEEISKAAANSDKDQLLSPREKSVYRALQLYKQISSESDTNLDNTLLALDRDSSYFRNFASSALNQNLDSWVTEPKINKFFEDAANLIYFTR